MQCKVIKRDGTEELFNRENIESVIYNVGIDCDKEIDEDLIERLTDQVETEVGFSESITTAGINDIVEKTLMVFQLFDEAKQFILFREKNKVISNMSSDADAMAKYVFMSRYSRYIPRRRRRETWNEAVDRVKDMHVKKYPDQALDISWAFEQVREKRVLPSMRSMQFGGAPIEEKNSRMYNCTYSVVDRPEFFSESIYLLLCGCGVGFSVEPKNINKLPILKKPDTASIQHIVIEDSVEGWAESIRVLIDSYVNGYVVEFVYRKIRTEGAKIRSGGKAPGHVPLRRAIEKCRTILDTIVDRDGKIKSIEAYDIVMHIADAVLSGGVRRSATICLFSPEDDDMLNAKTGDWFKTNPQRGRSNNSAKLIRDKTSYEQFLRIFNKQKEHGEPGFYFAGSDDHGTNPCVEIGLNPFMPDGKSGFQMCNLTTINGVKLKTMNDFEIATKAAAIIGTCQAGFTTFNYPDQTTSELCVRESLLGVSITGIMDSPDITLVPENLRKMAQLAIETNKSFAKRIGIPQAARVTCVKPEGSSSLLLDTASGIHPRFGKKYLRRVQANKNDPVYQHFKKNNPHACEESVWSTNKTDDVITFCVSAPENAITRDDITAIEFLKIVKMVQLNWVLPGTALPESSPGLAHNVSNTVTVKDHEWDEVCEFIFQNKDYFTGIAMLPDSGSTIYQQAPHEVIRSSDDEMAWSNLKEGFQNVDYTSLDEADDNTKLKDIIVCAGGTCDIS